MMHQRSNRSDAPRLIIRLLVGQRVQKVGFLWGNSKHTRHLMCAGAVLRAQRLPEAHSELCLRRREGRAPQLAPAFLMRARRHERANGNDTGCTGSEV
eukprot:4254691-Pleurochrysis_carterae.AAC.2